MVSYEVMPEYRLNPSRKLWVVKKIEEKRYKRLGLVQYDTTLTNHKTQAGALKSLKKLIKREVLK